jgi:2-polyprenyl-6-methoxyphenol hydroxylase-like FAD-dependent oxidoreductase
MKASYPKVMIIGGGTGGLCLAHGLRASGIDVRVFERDRTPTDRLQGYRLHISASGNRALHSCLPAENFKRLIEASAKSNTAVTFLDHHLKHLLQIEFPAVDPQDPASERPVSRIALRRILLQGLDEVVVFNKSFSSYKAAANEGISVTFEDGSTATGDLLIGADGASSRVRRQLLPHAQRKDTGITAISGKFRLDSAARHETPEAIFKGPTLVTGPDGCFLFASAIEYPPESDPSYDADEYVMWGFSARRELLERGRTAALAREEAKRLTLSLMGKWHSSLRRLVERAEPSTVTVFAVKSSEPVEPWPTGNVTLLGDAIHSMTPYQGMGANMALRDAAALREAIMSIASGRSDPVTALRAYEREMLDRGFAAVNASLKQMRRFHSRSPAARLFSRGVMRVVDMARPLQGVFRGER